MLNIIFELLQKDFTDKLPDFVSAQNQTITNLLLNMVYILPLLLLSMGWEFRRLWRECRAVIKTLKILPKAYLLKIKTSKYLKENDILDKMEMITF